MRIIYLHQYFNTPEMSGSTRSYEFGRRLVASGHSVDMITSFRQASQGKGWFTTEAAGMRIHWLPVPYSNRMTNGARVRAFIRFSLAAAGRAASLDADVVLASSTPLTIAVPAVYAARRKRIPMVFEVRDLWPELPIAMGVLRDPVSRFAAGWLERFAYANATRVIALSPGMAAGVARAGYPPGRISVVPNAADLELLRRDAARGRAFREKLRIGADRILVVYAGTLGRINGVGYLVRVAAALRQEKGIAFLIVGDGQERDAVEALARELDVLNRNLFLLSGVAKLEMTDVLSAADVATSLFLPIPAMEANSANKFFDGLAAGCCMAVNYGGWQAELLAAADAGLRLSAEPRDGALELLALAKNPDRIRTAARNARRLAEESFSRDVLAARFEAVIADAVASSSRRDH